MRRYGWLVAVGLVLTAMSQPLHAAGRTFSWHAEVIRVDGTVATMRVGLTEAALAAIDRTPGAALALTWAAEGDLVVYAPAVADMRGIPSGFLVEAELVSVDPDSRTALVKVALPRDAAAQAARAAGTWVKVTAPVVRSEQAAALSLAAAARPAPRTVRAVAAAAGIDGSWTLTAIRKSGVSVGADCTIKNDAGRLSGVCTTARNGSSPFEGEITGSAVTLRHLQPIQGDLYVWKGELAASGIALKGTVQVADETVEFTGSK